MINHGRTLLLNISGSNKADITYPGEEIIPEEYVAKNLSPDLQKVYDLIFNKNADRAAKNIRCREILNIVHSNELGAYLLEFDPRITYSPNHDLGLCRGLTFGSTVKEITNTNKGFYLFGDTSNLQNNSYRDLIITVISSTELQIKENAPYNKTTTLSYSDSGGITDTIAISDTNLSFKFNTGDLPSWRIVILSKPNRNLLDVYNDLTNLGSPFYIFGDTTKETNKNLKKIWADNKNIFTYRLSAFILSYITRVNELI